MSTKEKLSQEITDCLNDCVPLLELLQGKNKDKNFSFHIKYQEWYSKAVKIAQFLAPDRFQEFKSYYEIDPRRKSLGYGTYVIQDFIKGVIPGGYNYTNFDSTEQTLKCLYNQYTILNSLKPRVNSILADISEALYIELQDTELTTAKTLLKVNLRAAGVIAGVVLEGYLLKIVTKHEIKPAKKHLALADLNELLKSNNLYDTTTWRKIAYLGDIRNYCAHKKDKEPTKEQVEELIEGANWVIKNVY
jgi:hypothetical protein